MLEANWMSRLLPRSAISPLPGVKFKLFPTFVWSSWLFLVLGCRQMLAFLHSAPSLGWVILVMGKHCTWLSSIAWLKPSPDWSAEGDSCRTEKPWTCQQWFHTHLDIAHYPNSSWLAHFSSSPWPPSSAFSPSLLPSGTSEPCILHAAQSQGKLLPQTGALF